MTIAHNIQVLMGKIERHGIRGLASSWIRSYPHDRNQYVYFNNVNPCANVGKYGLPPEETVNTAKHIMSECCALQFAGLMTIGRYGYNLTLGPNPDFQVQAFLKNSVWNASGRLLLFF